MAALFTFFLHTGDNVRLVELLGSWDNFSKPYTLHRDYQKEGYCWNACPKFEKIIFDGDQPEWCVSRDGCLKQGGRYWFYYVLNDVEEYCDPAQEIAADCPLLPGQRLNVVDLPIEIDSRPSENDYGLSDLSEMVYDPAERYRRLPFPEGRKDLIGVASSTDWPVPCAYRSVRSECNDARPCSRPGSDQEIANYTTNPQTDHVSQPQLKGINPRPTRAITGCAQNFTRPLCAFNSTPNFVRSNKMRADDFPSPSIVSSVLQSDYIIVTSPTLSDNTISTPGLYTPRRNSRGSTDDMRVDVMNDDFNRWSFDFEQNGSESQRGLGISGAHNQSTSDFGVYHKPTRLVDDLDDLSFLGNIIS